jgi:hypothetical protein
MKKVWDLISFNGSYWTASLTYIGLSLVLFAVTPSDPNSFAQSGCGGETVCQPGYICCNGNCCLATTCPVGGCCGEY